MVMMDLLNEPEILFNLQLRFRKKYIFTYIGPTLIVLNPYQNIE